MLQPLNQSFDIGLMAGKASLQAVHDFHITHAQQTFERTRFVRGKCSAVCLPKATQPQVELEQATPATPAQAIRHGV